MAEGNEGLLLLDDVDDHIDVEIGCDARGKGNSSCDISVLASIWGKSPNSSSLL